MKFLPGPIKEKGRVIPASFPLAAQQGTEWEPSGAMH